MPLFIEAQNFELRLVGATEVETQILDSLETQNNFKDINNAKSFLDSTLLSLQKLGYVESEIISFSKLNDSVLQASLKLKKRYHNIYVYFKNELINRDILKNI